MTDYWTVQQGLIIMLVGIVTSMSLIFMGGEVLDHMYYKFDEMGFLDGDNAEEWHVGDFSTFFINMYYGVCVLVAILSIAFGVGTILRRQQYDRYLGDYSQEWRGY
jgi:hypothetical protein